MEGKPNFIVMLMDDVSIKRILIIKDIVSSMY